MPVIRKRNRPQVRKILTRLKELQVDPSRYDRTGEGWYATPKKILKNGRRFLHAFKTKHIVKGVRVQLDVTQMESPVCVSIRMQGVHEYFPQARIKLGFEPKVVYVEGIQGTHGRGVAELNKKIGEPWPNVMLKIIEQRAREAGYEKMVIQNPKRMHWYEKPITGYSRGTAKHEGLVEEIQGMMRALYAIVAKKNGYKKNARGDYEKAL